jgi:polyisoprenoid-binding protein YceI
MKQFIVLSAFLVISLCASAQNQLYSIKASEISFFSKGPIVDIEAKNTKTSSVINADNRELLVRIPIAQFQFKNKLMQQHFNENYLESEKFPFATFKGTINELINFSKSGTYNLSASGILNIHGIDQERTMKGKLIIDENNLNLQGRFDVMLTDHKIDIPKLFFKKIAEKIAVTASFNYIPNKN